MNVGTIIKAPEQRLHVFVSITALFEEVDPVYQPVFPLGRVERQKVGNLTLETKPFTEFFFQSLKDLGCDITIFSARSRDDTVQLLELLCLPRRFVCLPSDAQQRMGFDVLEVDATVKPDRTLIVDDHPARWQQHLQTLIVDVDHQDELHNAPTAFMMDFLDATAIVRECVCRINVFKALSTAAALQAMRSDTLFSAGIFVPPSMPSASHYSSLAASMGARIANTPDEATHVIYSPPSGDLANTTMPPVAQASPSANVELVTVDWLHRAHRSCIAWPGTLFAPYYSHPKITLHRCFDAEIRAHPRGTAEQRVAAAWLMARIFTEPASYDVWVEISFLRQQWKEHGIDPNDDLLSVVLGTPKPVKHRGNTKNRQTKMPPPVNITSTDFMISHCEQYVAQGDAVTSRPLPSQTLAVRKGFHSNPSYFASVATQTDTRTASVEAVPGILRHTGVVTKETQTPVRTHCERGAQTSFVGPGAVPPLQRAAYQPPPPDNNQRQFPPPPPPPPPLPPVPHQPPAVLDQHNGHGQKRGPTVRIFAKGFDNAYFDSVWFDRFKERDARFVDATIEWRSKNPADGAWLDLPPHTAEALLKHGGQVRLDGRQFLFTVTSQNGGGHVEMHQRQPQQPPPPAPLPQPSAPPYGALPPTITGRPLSAPTHGISAFTRPPLPPPRGGVAATTAASGPDTYNPYHTHQIPAASAAPTQASYPLSFGATPTPTELQPRPIPDRATVQFLRTLNVTIQELNSFAHRNRLEKICGEVTALDSRRGIMLRHVLDTYTPYTD